MEKKIYSFLQCLEIVSPDDKYDLEVYGQYYRVPSSGKSPVIESGNSTYCYDFKTQELVLLSDEGKEVYRKKVLPKTFAKSEYKWVRIAREEARITLGIDDVY